MMTITFLFLIASLIVLIMSAAGKAPLWVSVLLIWAVLALSHFPK
jgi:hypothetical protein